MQRRTTNSAPRVIDFSTHFSGPMASRELVNLGVDVIKVERPEHGDGNRALGAQVAGASGVHHALSSGTRSVMLHHADPAWSSVVDALVASADAVIVGARPADAARRGLDFQRLIGVKPDLVYCAITGFGEDGPWASRPAHGLQPDLMAGVVPLEWVDGIPKVPSGYKAHGTALAGLWAALGIMAALLRRTNEPGAQYVSISIWEAALAWMWREGVNDLNGLPQHHGFQELGSRYRLYAGSDRTPLLVCPIEEKFWSRFVDVLGLPSDWRTDGDWSTGADHGFGRDDEAEVIAARIATAPAAIWDERLTEVGVPVASGLSVGGALHSAQAAARGSVVRIAGPDGEVAVPASPLSVSGVRPGDDTSVPCLARRHRDRAGSLTPAPRLGEHTHHVLQELGLGTAPVPSPSSAP